MLPADLEAAIRASWATDTCDPVDLPWSSSNAARGQCGVTALVIQDRLGGDLLMATVLNPDGTRQGVHYWNRLPDGTELDLTREQFILGEQVQDDAIVQDRPDNDAGRMLHQYHALRDRVAAALASRS